MNNDYYSLLLKMPVELQKSMKLVLDTPLPPQHHPFAINFVCYPTLNIGMSVMVWDWWDIYHKSWLIFYVGRWSIFMTVRVRVYIQVLVFNKFGTWHYYTQTDWQVCSIAKLKDDPYTAFIVTLEYFYLLWRRLNSWKTTNWKWFFRNNFW